MMTNCLFGQTNPSRTQMANFLRKTDPQNDADDRHALSTKITKKKLVSLYIEKKKRKEK